MQASSSRRLDVPETAKLIRKAVRAEFPGFKFSVRSKRYAGGASIHVTWTDGPRHSDVQKLCDRYRGATFDGMTDMKSYHSSLLTTEDGAEEVRFGADFVFAHRYISPERYAEIASEIAAISGTPCDLSPQGADWNTRYPLIVHDDRLWLSSNEMEYGSQLAHRLAALRAYTPSAP